jgi:uncharacterized membrane protein
VFSPKKDLMILGIIAFFLFLIVLVALFASPTAFWYGQIILQLAMAGTVLWIAFGGEE